VVVVALVGPVDAARLQELPALVVLFLVLEQLAVAQV
jgi:hypothetical protein